MNAKKLSQEVNKKTGNPVIGVFATGDPRIDSDSRTRAKNIIKLTAEAISGEVNLPDSTVVQVVYSDILVDTEREADKVAKQFLENGVNILVCVPDTWAFPQLTLISLLGHFPEDTPINLTCGNSAPKPGVVFTHAVSGAAAQYGRLLHINVGSWPDEGAEPPMSERTKTDLIDWLFAAVTYQGLKGKRMVFLGHDSMGMETALPHILATRNSFGLELTRLDMKLLADMLNKEAYDKNELKELRSWIDSYCGDKIELKEDIDNTRFNKSLAMYLILKDMLNDLDAVGGGFMSQLEWGSDLRGIPLPVADTMESLFNSTFDHKGNKAPIPFATEADVQGAMTMLFMTWLSGGNPPLFMDFRKVWEGWEVENIAKKTGTKLPKDAIWHTKGFVDGDNSGSASFNWAAKPGASIKDIMKGVSFPLADPNYFPGMGNSVSFISPGGIDGIAARLAYSSLSGMFTMVWDETETVQLPKAIETIVSNLSNVTWPHTFYTPKHASMHEYKHYAPANHVHMTWGLNPARLQYWMDMTNVLSGTPWNDMPKNRDGVDRPLPLLYVTNGGEDNAKMLRKK